MTTQQTERELLELAAKAAGYDVRWHEAWQCFVHVGPHNITNPATMAGQRMMWVPLDDDGDVLRLAVRLRLCVEHNHAADQQRWVAANRAGCEVCYAPVGCVEDDFDDELQRGAATRRAIVRAAAEIGKAMP